MTGALAWSLVGELQSCKLWGSAKKKKDSHIDQWNRTETRNRSTSIYSQMNFNKDVKVISAEKIEIDVNSKWYLQHWEGSSEKEHSIFKEEGVKWHDASVQFSSVQFSCSVMSDSLRPHESQHARTPCPSPSPGVHPNSHPLSQWCHPAISSYVVPFSSHPQSLPASESFPVSQLFTWGGQSTGVSASASVLPMNTQD